MHQIITNQQIENLRQITKVEYGQSINAQRAQEIANSLGELVQVAAKIVRENPELRDQVNQIVCDFSDNV